MTEREHALMKEAAQSKLVALDTQAALWQAKAQITAMQRQAVKADLDALGEWKAAPAKKVGR